MARDSARSNQLPLGGCPQFVHGTEGKSRHQSFGVDVGVEEGAAERIQNLDHLKRRDLGDLPPAANCNLSSARVDGEDEFLGAEVVCEFFCSIGVDFAILNECRTDYHPARAGVEQGSCCADRTNASSNLAG